MRVYRTTSGDELLETLDELIHLQSRQQPQVDGSGEAACVLSSVRQWSRIVHTNDLKRCYSLGSTSWQQFRCRTCRGHCLESFTSCTTVHSVWGIHWIMTLHSASTFEHSMLIWLQVQLQPIFFHSFWIAVLNSAYP